jgi:hypothetical protein
VRNGSGTSSSEKLEAERMGIDEIGCTHRRSALYAQQATAWWFISQEKDAFLFQPHAQFGHGIEELKSLEV